MADPAKDARATLRDLLSIPEDRRRHELIDGVLIEKEAASGGSARSCRTIGATIS